MLLLQLTLGCALSHHPVLPSTLGAPASSADLEALLDVPGPVKVETVASADWEVPLSGLLDLSDPAAAGLQDNPEPIQIYFHAIEHPDRGLFLVDTGVERALRDHPDQAAIRGLVARAMHPERMVIQAPLGEWLGGRGVAGVLLTHLHLDHISGMADVPAGTPIYTGPGETGAKSAQNLLLRSTTDRELDGKGEIQEWAFQPDPTGTFRGVMDVFGDGSVWALWLPGHTPGSTAYVARTPDGPVLLTGDVCHTRWGWDHGVGPGTFSADREAGGQSLDALHALVDRHPGMDVRLGHQR